MTIYSRISGFRKQEKLSGPRVAGMASQNDQNTPAPPGWYPHGDQLRWWDGTQWTEHVHKNGTGAPESARPMTYGERYRSRFLVTAASVTALIMTNRIITANRKGDEPFGSSASVLALVLDAIFIFCLMGAVVTLIVAAFPGSRRTKSP